MLSAVFVCIALLEMFALSQLNFWGGSIGILYLLILIFRRGTKTKELLFASTLYLFLSTLFVANNRLIVALLAMTLAVGGLLLFTSITDSLVRSRGAIFVQGCIALMFALILQQGIFYISIHGSVQFTSEVGVYCLSITISCILLGVATLFLRVKPGER